MTVRTRSDPNNQVVVDVSDLRETCSLRLRSQLQSALNLDSFYARTDKKTDKTIKKEKIESKEAKEKTEEKLPKGKNKENNGKWACWVEVEVDSPSKCTSKLPTTSAPSTRKNSRIQHRKITEDEDENHTIERNRKRMRLLGSQNVSEDNLSNIDSKTSIETKEDSITKKHDEVNLEKIKLESLLQSCKDVSSLLPPSRPTSPTVKPNAIQMHGRGHGRNTTIWVKSGSIVAVGKEGAKNYMNISSNSTDITEIQQPGSIPEHLNNGEAENEHERLSSLAEATMRVCEFTSREDQSTAIDFSADWLNIMKSTVSEAITSLSPRTNALEEERKPVTENDNWNSVVGMNGLSVEESWSGQVSTAAEEHIAFGENPEEFCQRINFSQETIREPENFTPPPLSVSSALALLDRFALEWITHRGSIQSDIINNTLSNSNSRHNLASSVYDIPTCSSSLVSLHGQAPSHISLLNNPNSEDSIQSTLPCQSSPIFITPARTLLTTAPLPTGPIFNAPLFTASPLQNSSQSIFNKSVYDQYSSEEQLLANSTQWQSTFSRKKDTPELDVFSEGYMGLAPPVGILADENDTWGINM